MDSPLRLPAVHISGSFAGCMSTAPYQLDDIVRIRAAVLSTGARLVAVDESAAVLHGFGVLDHAKVNLAGPPTETARAQSGLRVHGIKLAPDELTRVHGLLTTTAERTVVDLARMRPAGDALATVDTALRVGACTSETLARQVSLQRSRRGIVAARRIVAFGNPLAESPMESRLRMRILDANLPAPTLQWPVHDDSGRLRYRLDLAWPQWRIAVEYDGAGHMDRAKQRYDIARRTWLAHAGWTVLWVTDHDVYLNYLGFLRQLDDVLRLAAA